MPFRYDTYDSPYTGSIADIMGRRAEIRANAVRQSGDAQARAAELAGHGKAQIAGSIANAGMQAVGNIGHMIQQRREAPMRAQEAELARRERFAKIAEIEDRLRTNASNREEVALAQQSIKSAMAAAGGDHQKAAEWLVSQGWPLLAEQVQKTAPKPPELHNVPQGAAAIDPRNPAAGPVYTAPVKPAEPPATIDGAIIAAYRSGDKAEMTRLLALKRQSGDAGRAPEGSGAAEPLVPIIGPDGQPVLVPRSQAVNKRPASNREQGRPVTSGDANRIAELDTSLNDLATLGSTLSETAKATGTAAKVGAMLPNPITEFTGWGTDAKKRQGVIDRVKQVIGKALEGGVLRKEDEYKYTKILPTIGDTQAVATSKLEGLRKALILRRDTTLDALEDSNYDVSKHRQRSPAAPVAPPVADPLGLFK